MKTRRSFRSVIAATIVAGLISACGSGTESSESASERTRNATASAAEPSTVVLYTGFQGTTTPKVYMASLDTAGPITGSELFSDTSGSITGIVSLNFDSRTSTFYWATQESTTLKIRSRSLADSVTNTLYSIPNAFANTLAFDAVNNKLIWGGTESGSPKIWIGDPSGSTATVAAPYEFRSVTSGDNKLYGIYGTYVGKFVTSTFSRTQLVSGIGTQAWASIADETNSQMYYANGYGGTPEIYQIALSGGTPLNYVTPSRSVIAMAMKSNGSLVWGDGKAPATGTSFPDSTFNVVDPVNTLSSRIFMPSPALKLTAMWIVEQPQTDVDPTVSGDGEIGSVYTCSDAEWSSDLTAQRLSRAPDPTRVYQWYLDGVVIPGAKSNIYTSTTNGMLKCSVEATNIAGTTVAESVEVAVGDIPLPPDTSIEAPTVSTGAPASEAATPEESTSGGSTSGSTPSSGAGSTTSSGSAVASYPTIKVKWTFARSNSSMKATFKKVSGAKTYSLVVTGATKKTAKCTTSKSTITCKVSLKKGTNTLKVNAKNSAKAIVAQKISTKTVR